MWTSGQVAKFCGVERTTIHDRTTRYAWALSPDATPPKGKDRRYTARDVAILVEVHRMSKANFSDEEIEASLRGAIRRNEFDDIEQFPEMLDDTAETVPISKYEIDLSRTGGALEAARREAQVARADADALRESLAKEKMRADMLEQQLADLKGNPEAQERIASLREQLAEQKTKAEMYERLYEEEKKKKGLFRR